MTTTPVQPVYRVSFRLREAYTILVTPEDVNLPPDATNEEIWDALERPSNSVLFDDKDWADTDWGSLEIDDVDKEENR